jgi:hypothetical protein
LWISAVSWLAGIRSSEPLGNAFDFRQVVRFRIVIALDPAFDLAFEIALRFAQVAKPMAA